MIAMGRRGADDARLAVPRAATTPIVLPLQSSLHCGRDDEI